ncbi:MAG: rhodanese-like domain-containing protein [Salinivirgaceae bacterium]|nr:rhodanese-like domain-containing protein [Salinivirgaceae bacterium]
MNTDQAFKNHNAFWIDDFKCISAKNAFELCQKSGVILDIRMPYLTLFKKFDVKNLLYIPFNKLKVEFKNIPTHVPVIIADSTGVKSREAIKLLMQQEYTNTAILGGGFVEWERDGLPVILDIKNRLSGSCMCQLKPKK